MGYESRLILVNKCFYDGKRQMTYAEEIASYDLSKVPNFSNWFKKQPVTNCYFLDWDGNTSILKDKCDEPLKEAGLQEVIKQLEFCMETEDYYRRFSPVVAMLKAFAERENEWEELAVLHYGY